MAVVALAACTSDPQSAQPIASVPGSPSASATPTPTPSPVATTSPFSGRKGGVNTPVMVVKYDNTPSAQPHRGLPSADIVYIEPVEWGLTRIAAVFSTKFPSVVGPVRSARISDLELLSQFGRVALVFSGAQGKLWPEIEQADLVAVSPDVDSPGFSRERGTGRVAPFNMMADPDEILADVGGSIATSSDMGWVFDKDRPKGGEKARTVTVRWPSSRASFHWNSDRDAYDVSFDGRTARDTDSPGVQRATTVIVQYVKQTDSGYGDKFGGVTPLARTVGHGKALMLRNGRAYDITWERPTEESPTAYLDAQGDPIAMDPGQVWILIKDRSDKRTSIE